MKFFNTNRFQLLRGKRLQKYVIYAVGEIILVVIGILIALAINNWKTNRAEVAELNRIIQVVKNDLNDDLNETTEIIEFSKEPNKLIVKILYNGKFQDSIRNCQDCRYLMTSGNISNFNRQGYNMLSNFNKEAKSLNAKVDSILWFYNKYDKEGFDFQNNIIISEIVDNMKYLRDNYSWYSDYYVGSYCNEDCLNYFDSADYRNRLTYFEALYFDNYLTMIKEYQVEIKNLIKLLKDKKT
ncbi:DUF6090 family protein [Psychroserpens damuponensis]|uniref:DUF6090 family protein n=1 Tax=Psychroserpens damuponensis TaxID=943936 RepID=UPI000694125F|nr:DUF6090 family protein [Psychroserpens damuponensis]